MKSMKMRERFFEAVTGHMENTHCRPEDFFILASENALELLIEEAREIAPFTVNGSDPLKFAGVEIVADKRIPDAVLATLPVGCKDHVEEHILEIQHEADHIAGHCRDCGLKLSAALIDRGGVLYCPYCQRKNYINEVLGDEF